MKAVNPILRMFAAVFGILCGGFVGARTMQVSKFLSMLNGRTHEGVKWETFDAVIMATVVACLAVLMTNLFILDDE